MKKGFTLIEMLIVVVVLVTLMSITFKLSSIGDEQSCRTTTVNRMQRLENCLSGYYAAFGSYPPVKLHGSRDYNQKVNSHGFQTGDEKQISLNWNAEDFKNGARTTQEAEDWKQSRAACRAQPIAARFPFPDGYNDVLEARSELAKERLQDGDMGDVSEEYRAIIMAGYDDGYTKNPGRHNLTERDWSESQLFEFGLFSFLLPRYLVMMHGDEDFFNRGQQWITNNTIPSDPLGTGEKFSSWSSLKSEVDQAIGGNNAQSLARVINIPSQGVCARWMPNLADSCYCNRTYTRHCFGIDIQGDQRIDDGDYNIYAPGGSKSGSTSQQYVLDVVTMTDGWHHEFYYYSPAPYQSYTVWSAGPNGRTFPPWASRDGFTSAQNKCIGAWIDDDIIHMSN